MVRKSDEYIFPRICRKNVVKSRKSSAKESENPCEAVLVNVVGSRQVADMAVEYGAEKMIMVSTDKAVNPTNGMLETFGRNLCTESGMCYS